MQYNNYSLWNLLYQNTDSEDEEEVNVPATTSPKKTPKSAKRPATETPTDTPRPKRGKIAKRNTHLWDNFKYSDDDATVVICVANEACQAKIKRPQGSTSVMMAHLRTKHPVQYVAYLEKTGQALKEKVSICIRLNYCIKISNSIECWYEIFEYVRELQQGKVW